MKKQDMAENEKKKRYLQQYQQAVRELARLEAELEELRIMRVSISVKMDGMPHTRNKSDLSGYAAKLDGLERKIVAERYRRINIYQEIRERIATLQDQNEKEVIFYRYVKGLDWWEIAEKLNYSERWIMKMHGMALSHLEVEEEFIEVQ